MIEDDSTRCSVLLIDDESFAQDIIAHGLKGCVGHQLMYESSPERAVEVAREIDATVVLVDLRMPGGLDGFAVIARLKAHPDTPDIPVILLSSEDDPDIKAKAFAVGASDYMVKWGSGGVCSAAASTAARKSSARSPRISWSSRTVAASGTAFSWPSGATQNAAAASVRSQTPWSPYCRVNRVMKYRPSPASREASSGKNQLIIGSSTKARARVLLTIGASSTMAAFGVFEVGIRVILHAS